MVTIVTMVVEFKPWFKHNSPVFGGLPEPNRACLVGVYAFLIWNDLCDQLV